MHTHLHSPFSILRNDTSNLVALLHEKLPCEYGSASCSIRYLQGPFSM